MKTIIELTDVKKVFHTDEVETHALNGLTFAVMEGEFVSISGPSGCGKSTLLSLLGLLDTASTGRYVLAGHDVSSISRADRAMIRNKEIGFVFQAFNLISDLSTEENVELPLTYRKDIDKKTRKELVSNALELVGMSHRSKHFPSQLSGGQQQRVAVARAIAGKPSVLLADEPTGNLDSKNAESVMALLEDLNAKGVTICMVTHDPSLAMRTQRNIELLDGAIVNDSIATAKVVNG